MTSGFFGEVSFAWPVCDKNNKNMLFSKRENRTR